MDWILRVLSNLNESMIPSKPHPKRARTPGRTIPERWESQTPPSQLTTVTDSLCILQLFAHIHLACKEGPRIAGAGTFGPPGCRTAQGIAGACRALPWVVLRRREVLQEET